MVKKKSKNSRGKKHGLRLSFKLWPSRNPSPVIPGNYLQKDESKAVKIKPFFRLVLYNNVVLSVSLASAFGHYAPFNRKFSSRGQRKISNNKEPLPESNWYIYIVSRLLNPFQDFKVKKRTCSKKAWLQVDIF